MWFTSTFLSVLSIYEYLSSSFAALHVKVSGWFSTDWWVCWVHVSVHTAVVDAARPDSLPSPSSAAVSSGQRGEISSPSTAMATACKSPWASCTPQRPFTVRGWLLMSPGECQGKIEVDTHAQTLVRNNNNAYMVIMVNNMTHEVSEHTQNLVHIFLIFIHVCIMSL